MCRIIYIDSWDGVNSDEKSLEPDRPASRANTQDHALVPVGFGRKVNTPVITVHIVRIIALYVICQPHSYSQDLSHRCTLHFNVHTNITRSTTHKPY